MLCDHCQACHKCGRSWFLRGNNVEALHRRGKMILRLHLKKCKGTKNLRYDEVDKIVDKQSRIHSAPLSGIMKMEVNSEPFDIYVPTRSSEK